jgi:hypothetical protein
MKTLTAVAFLLSTFVAQQDVFAQARGPRYNPPGGGSSSPSRSSGPSSSSRGPSYNPGRSGSSMPSTPSRSSGTFTPSRPSPSFPSSTPRGPSYNPGRSTPSIPSRPSTPVVTRPMPTPSAPRGPTYNPNPGRPSTPGPVITRPSNPGSMTPRGPRYNPTPSRPNGPVVTRPGSSTPRYYPRPSTPSYRIPGYQYNRPVGPNYGRSYGRSYQRPISTQYNTRYYHRPFGYTPVRYVSYYHSPFRTPFINTVHYSRSYDWYTYVYRSNPNYIYANWIFYPASGYSNGYVTIENYPYYVYNGYRNRYSSTDYCSYQLVDSNDHKVLQNYWNQTCNTGYDSCSIERDRLNAQMGDYRYFCSETYRDNTFDFSVPTYDETNYSSEGDLTEDENTCEDTNRDGMCDDFEGTSSTCSDSDNDGYCDPGTYDAN